MRRALALAALPCLAACGPDLSSWRGTWAGNVAVNTGRQPEVVPGSLVIGEGGTAQLAFGPLGAPGRRFTCRLEAVAADGAGATFQPGACEVTQDVADGCTATLTLSTARAERQGDTLSCDASGRLATACTAGSSVTDLGVQLSARR